jgi:nicotinamidase-related amidase
MNELRGKTMTTLENRPNTALMVVDMQVGVIAGAHGRDAVVKNVGALVAKARRDHVAVIWVQHADAQLARGSDGWRIVRELTPDAAETLVEKVYGDAFEDTDLEAVLARLEVGRLVVVGAQSDACIRSTIHGAFVRGYDVTLVSDAHTTEDQSEWGAPPPDKVIAHTNLYWTYQTAPGRKAGTVETDNVDFVGAP